MKAIFVTINLILSVISYAQINSSIEEKIDSLKKTNYEYSTLIEKNNLLIQELSNELILSNVFDTVFSISVIANESVFIRKTPNLLDRSILTLPKGKNLTIVGYKNEFFVVRYDNEVGYAHNSNIPMNKELISIKEYYTIKEKKEAEEYYKRLQEKNRQERLVIMENESKIRAEKLVIKKQQMIKKYGMVNAEKIMTGKIWIGMTSEMAIDSWGEPEDINRTVTNYGTSEQWIYSSKNYLYFNNGKLTGWQD